MIIMSMLWSEGHSCFDDYTIKKKKTQQRILVVSTQSPRLTLKQVYFNIFSKYPSYLLFLWMKSAYKTIFLPNQGSYKRQNNTLSNFLFFFFTKDKSNYGLRTVRQVIQMNKTGKATVV
uniref:Uncharacterized protein n=1 Tax=Apteryx owenii TaxID=8824 RepID=A0A8B9Q4S3_APTOW